MPSASRISRTFVATASALSIGVAAGQAPDASTFRTAGCVKRTATAKPPPRLPPAPTNPERQKAPVKTVGGIKSCPPGQVPKTVPQYGALFPIGRR